MLTTLYNSRATLAFTLFQVINVISNTLSALIGRHAILAKRILLIASFTMTIIDIVLILAGIAYEITKNAATTCYASQVNQST